MPRGIYKKREISRAVYIERIYGHIHPEPNSGCWLWDGALGSGGYGIARFPLAGVAKMHGAHRVVYTIERGPIPAGLTLDHLCYNPICVNPEHLEPVRQEVNSSRAGLRAWKRRRAHALLHDERKRELAALIKYLLG